MSVFGTRRNSGAVDYRSVEQEAGPSGRPQAADRPQLGDEGDRVELPRPRPYSPEEEDGIRAADKYFDGVKILKESEIESMSFAELKAYADDLTKRLHDNPIAARSKMMDRTLSEISLLAYYIERRADPNESGLVPMLKSQTSRMVHRAANLTQNIPLLGGPLSRTLKTDTHTLIDSARALRKALDDADERYHDLRPDPRDPERDALHIEIYRESKEQEMSKNDFKRKSMGELSDHADKLTKQLYNTPAQKTSGQPFASIHHLVHDLKSRAESELTGGGLSWALSPRAYRLMNSAKALEAALAHAERSYAELPSSSGDFWDSLGTVNAEGKFGTVNAEGKFEVPYIDLYRRSGEVGGVSATALKDLDRLRPAYFKQRKAEQLASPTRSDKPNMRPEDAANGILYSAKRVAEKLPKIKSDGTYYHLDDPFEGHQYSQLELDKLDLERELAALKARGSTGRREADNIASELEAAIKKIDDVLANSFDRREPGYATHVLTHTLKNDIIQVDGQLPREGLFKVTHYNLDNEIEAKIYSELVVARESIEKRLSDLKAEDEDAAKTLGGDYALELNNINKVLANSVEKKLNRDIPKIAARLPSQNRLDSGEQLEERQYSELTYTERSIAEKLQFLRDLGHGVLANQVSENTASGLKQINTALANGPKAAKPERTATALSSDAAKQLKAEWDANELDTREQDRKKIIGAMKKREELIARARGMGITDMSQLS